MADDECAHSFAGSLAWLLKTCTICLFQGTGTEEQGAKGTNKGASPQEECSCDTYQPAVTHINSLVSKAHELISQVEPLEQRPK